MRSWYFFRKFLSFNYNFSLRDDLDETDSSSGKVLPQSDYLKKVSLRKDIFTSQSARILYASVAVCLIIAVIAGVWLSTHEIVEITTDFFEDMPEERGAKIVRSLPEVNATVHTHPQGEGSLLKKGAGRRTGGGGNPSGCGGGAGASGGSCNTGDYPAGACGGGNGATGYCGGGGGA